MDAFTDNEVSPFPYYSNENGLSKIETDPKKYDEGSMSLIGECPIFCDVALANGNFNSTDVNSFDMFPGPNEQYKYVECDTKSYSNTNSNSRSNSNPNSDSNPNGNYMSNFENEEINYGQIQPHQIHQYDQSVVHVPHHDPQNKRHNYHFEKDENLSNYSDRNSNIKYSPNKSLPKKMNCNDPSQSPDNLEKEKNDILSDLSWLSCVGAVNIDSNEEKSEIINAKRVKLGDTGDPDQKSVHIIKIKSKENISNNQNTENSHLIRGYPRNNRRSFAGANGRNQNLILRSGCLSDRLKVDLPEFNIDRDFYKYISNIKPPFSYSTIICMAMRETRNKKMTLSGIYKWIVDNFLYFRMADQCWQKRDVHKKCDKKIDKKDLHIIIPFFPCTPALKLTN
ncbi:hypothetical protein A3Q56_04850 [Intoshia linei]|uniref:Fork-head domain-containing protein n=1 Tax=Intoshia linei TaxID=1819745 RepID=A0A177AZX9_9BILA|nr:hypothetical protein A3Q56_04850 [Intoshia linei]